MMRFSAEQLNHERQALLAFLAVPRAVPRMGRCTVDHDRIRRLRAMRFTQEQIAQMVGCSVPTVHRVLKGGRP